MSVCNPGSLGGVCRGDTSWCQLGYEMPGVCVLDAWRCVPEVPRDARLGASDKLWDANIGPQKEKLMRFLWKIRIKSESCAWVYAYDMMHDLLMKINWCYLTLRMRSWMLEWISWWCMLDSMDDTNHGDICTMAWQDMHDCMAIYAWLHGDVCLIAWMIWVHSGICTYGMSMHECLMMSAWWSMHTWHEYAWMLDDECMVVYAHMVWVCMNDWW